VKLVVGLGNPGSKYCNTRHNLGYMVIDELGSRQAIDLSQEKFHAWIGIGEICDQKIVLAKPSTFVNRSGQAVLAIGRFYQLDIKDVLIIADDMALPIGKLRIREKGGSGGHNGLKDIRERLGTADFARLRLGIDAAEYNATQHVLGKFTDREKPIIMQEVRKAADAVTCWVDKGITTAMNTFNVDPNSQNKRSPKKPENNSKLEDES